MDEIGIHLDSLSKVARTSFQDLFKKVAHADFSSYLAKLQVIPCLWLNPFTCSSICWFWGLIPRIDLPAGSGPFSSRRVLLNQEFGPIFPFLDALPAGHGIAIFCNLR